MVPKHTALTRFHLTREHAKARPLSARPARPRPYRAVVLGDFDSRSRTACHRTMQLPALILLGTAPG